MVNVSVNEVVNVRASCLSLSMSACRHNFEYNTLFANYTILCIMHKA